MMKKLFVTGLTGVLFIFLAQAHASPIITNGLVTAYEFQGDANDTSGNGNDGTVYGATLVTDRFGNASSAYYFNGDDYILASATILPTADRTVALWLNADMVSNKPNLVGYGGSSSTPPGKSWLMGINHWGHAAYSISSHWDTNTLEYYYPSAPVNEWIHYAITTDSNGTKIYVNGTEMAFNSTFINNTVVAGTDLSIGVAVSKFGFGPYVDSNVGYFIGSMDDVLIYDRALSGSEIEQLATVPVPSTILLLGSSLTGLALTRCRRKICSQKCS